MENNPRFLSFCRCFTSSVFTLYEIYDVNTLFACLGKTHQHPALEKCDRDLKRVLNVKFFFK